MPPTQHSPVVVSHAAVANQEEPMIETLTSLDVQNLASYVACSVGELLGYTLSDHAEIGSFLR